MSQFRARVYSTPHHPGQRLWTYEVWDHNAGQVAATDNTCDWSVIFQMARRDVVRLHAAVRGGYYAPPKWLRGRR